MTKSAYTNSVKLTDEQRQHLLDQVDRAAKSAAGERGGKRRGAGGGGGARGVGGADKRKDKRFEFRQSNIAMIVEHPGGGVSRMLVCSRNLSAGGLSFLHGGFLHPKSVCKLALRKLDGTLHAMTGSVMNCRHVEGAVHEVGVKFGQRVKPEEFLNSIHAADQNEETSVHVPSLQGRLLLIENNETSLIGHHLQSTGLETIAVKTIDAALASMKSQSFDFVFFNVHLSEREELESIVQLRNEGHAQPIVLLSENTDQNHIAAIMTNKCIHVLHQPYASEAMFELLVKLAQEPHSEEGKQHAKPASHKAAA